jgi:hypothetical protein
MTRQHAIIAILALVSLITGCRSHKALAGGYPSEMVGTWKLLIRSGCDSYGVQSDTLVIRADGTFDQKVVTNDGRRLDLNMQHWQYYPSKDGGDVSLDERLEFFAPEIFGKRRGEAARTSEMLIVEYDGISPVIVLHPDSDCVYVKAEAPHSTSTSITK